MKRLLIILIIIFVFAFAGYRFLFLDGGSNSFTDNNSNFTVEVVDGIEYITDDLESFILVVFQNDLEISFTPQNPKSLRQQANIASYKIASNAGFIRGSYLDAEHAGLFFTDNKVVEPLTVDSTNQLSHVVFTDNQSNQLNFIEVENYQQKDNIEWAFQSGPLIIRDNQIQSKFIADAINGEQKTLRTVLGTIDSGSNFILVSKVGYNLAELVDFMFSLDAFDGEVISAINLDGGKSSAIYTEVNGYSFGETKRLPAIIGVK